MPVDKFGVPFFYASKPGGFFWEQGTNVENDSHFDPPDELNDNGDGTFTMHIAGATDFGIFKNTGFTDAIDGCDMDFVDTEARGYAWKASDVRDVEFKLLVNIEASNEDHGISMSGPTGHHQSNSDPCCQGFAYMFTCEYNLNPSTFRFRKEMWHVSYHTDPINGEWTHPLCNFKINNHGWVGLGYCRYNKKDGRGAGKDSVIVEVWFNPDPESNITNWTMLKRIEDKGIGWGNDGDDCGGAVDQVGTWSSAQFRCKSNAADADFTFKNVSLREIDPSLSFDDNPETPPEQPEAPTEIIGTFKFQNDINTLRTQSQCAGVGSGGGGGGTGTTMFYSVTDLTSDKELSDSSTFQNRTRVVMSPANSSSIFNGKTPHQLDIPLKKVGTPGASPLVYAKIWSSAGAVLYTSPTTFDPSTFTTSYVSKTFDMATNTHVLVTGDRIGIEYTGTSASNYVDFSYSGTATANTTYYQYEVTTWQTKSRSLSMNIWE